MHSIFWKIRSNCGDICWKKRQIRRKRNLDRVIFVVELLDYRVLISQNETSSWLFSMELYEMLWSSEQIYCRTPAEWKSRNCFDWTETNLQWHFLLSIFFCKGKSKIHYQCPINYSWQYHLKENFHVSIIHEFKRNDISGNLLTFLTDFLRNRKQGFILDRQSSPWANINVGVPRSLHYRPTFIPDIHWWFIR